MSPDDALQADFSAGPTRQIVELLLEHTVWLILIILLAVFCIFIPGYAQTGIFFNILEQSTFIGLLSVSLAIVIIAGQMDLSCEATMALSAMVTAWLGSSQGLNLGLPGWLIVPITLSAALLLGIVIGLFNALLVLRVGVTAFIATLATYIFFRGTVVAFNGGKGIFGLNSDLRAVATFRFLERQGWPSLRFSYSSYSLRFCERPRLDGICTSSAGMLSRPFALEFLSSRLLSGPL
jgi:ribose transport system permease protein